MDRPLLSERQPDGAQVGELLADEAGRRLKLMLHSFEARPEDAAAACALLGQSIVRSCAQDHGHDQLFLDSWLANKTPNTVAGWIMSPSSHCLLALGGSAVVGVAILTRKEKIGLLHVDPDMLGQSIGTSLLIALEAQAKAWGWSVCVSTAPAPDISSLPARAISRVHCRQRNHPQRASIRRKKEPVPCSTCWCSVIPSTTIIWRRRCRRHRH